MVQEVVGNSADVWVVDKVKLPDKGVHWVQYYVEEGAVDGNESVMNGEAARVHRDLLVGQPLDAQSMGEEYTVEVEEVKYSDAQKRAEDMELIGEEV